MNYVIEDNFDFYKELNDQSCLDSKTERLCMISHTLLTYNSITLPCEHSFNYLPLYTELCLHLNQKKIICPYCRSESNKLIPFIPFPTVKKIFGINFPADKCLPGPKCSVILKNGERKGLTCDNNGVEGENGTFCVKHNHHNIKKNDDWTTEMDNLNKAKSIIELKQLLREKGMKVCGVKKDLIRRLLS